MTGRRICTGLALALGLGAPLTAAEDPIREELEIAAVNGTYTELDGALAPVQQGPITIVLRSPAHELVVHGNRLVLDPGEGDLIDAVLEADVEGWGDLEVDLHTGAGVTRMQDRVVVGRQWLRAEGSIRLRAEPGGYELTLVEAFRPTVGILIESELARQMVQSCRSLRAFPMFAALDCDALSASLTRVQMPMPEPGTRYHVPSAFLTPGERAVFDRFATPGE